ncbi:unnamed protein product, partial [Mesorhabditis belari]|uniref:Uncharacterized protein n=1 Tax=Mesorhabditis belari TaxID=2138241 RepID=A0AAF3EDY1_9BILA
MPRHICIKSKDQLDGWNYNWIPIATDDSPYARMLKEIEEKEKFVQQYYLANKEQFVDVRTLQGQMRMEDATGVHGGSIVWQSKSHVRGHLIRAFLVLARAINEGHFNVNTVSTVSLKIESNWKVCCNRVKLDMSDSIYLVDVLKNIQRSFKRRHCMHYRLRFKSHVASYLNQLQEIQNTKSFDSPLRTTTEQIDEILRKLKPIFRNSPQSRDQLPTLFLNLYLQFHQRGFVYNLSLCLTFGLLSTTQIIGFIVLLFERPLYEQNFPIQALAVMAKTALLTASDRSDKHKDDLKTLGHQCNGKRLPESAQIGKEPSRAWALFSMKLLASYR